MQCYITTIYFSPAQPWYCAHVLRMHDTRLMCYKCTFKAVALPYFLRSKFSLSSYQNHIFWSYLKTLLLSSEASFLLISTLLLPWGFYFWGPISLFLSWDNALEGGLAPKVNSYVRPWSKWGSYTTKAISMLYEHIILTHLGTGLIHKILKVILHILKPSCSKDEFWKHSWCSKWIYQNKEKLHPNIYILKRHLKNRLLIKCAWTNHVWNWIPFITELVSAKYLLMLEQTPGIWGFKSSTVLNLC